MELASFEVSLHVKYIGPTPMKILKRCCRCLVPGYVEICSVVSEMKHAVKRTGTCFALRTRFAILITQPLSATTNC